MRLWQFWWRSLVFSTQYNPPEFVEMMMMSLAMTFAVTWFYKPNEWPYLALSSSFAIGAAVSMGVRELLIPSPRQHMVGASAIVMFVCSLFGLAYLTHYL